MSDEEEVMQAQEFMRRVTEAAQVIGFDYVQEKLAEIIQWDEDAACTASEFALDPSNDKFQLAMQEYIERAKLLAAFGQDRQARDEYGELESLEIWAEAR